MTAAWLAAFSADASALGVKLTLAATFKTRFRVASAMEAVGENALLTVDGDIFKVFAIV
jgi:hypothetical protein